MKKLICMTLFAAVLILTSCATAGAMVKTHIPNPDDSSAPLNKDEYIVLGTVSGTGYVIASDKEINSERKAASEGLRPAYDIILEGDTLRYGYLNDRAYPFQTAEEKAVANATYNMIETALFNGADAVVYVANRVSIIPVVNKDGSRNLFNPQSKITAKISGIAVKLRDRGTGIQPGTGEQENLDPATAIKMKKEAEKEAAAKTAAEAKASAEKAKAAQSAAAAKDNTTVSDTTTTQESQTSSAAAADTAQ
jgi:hypothetical protein